MGKKYIEKAVCNNESIELQGKVHWICIMPRLILAAIIIIIAVAVDESTSSYGVVQTAIDTVSTYRIIGAVVIDIVILWRPIIAFFTTEIGFTDKRLIGKSGLFRVHTIDIPLNKINSVYVGTGFWGDIFGYGRIKIGTSSGSYAFIGIADVEEFKNHLMWQIDHYEKKQPQGMPPMMVNPQASKTEE